MKKFSKPRPKRTKSRQFDESSEASQQALVVQYLAYNYPNVLYCASAGGMFTSPTQAIKMKRTGYVKGFPDLFIYEPRDGYCGLAIEMKKEKGGVISPEQKEWNDRLNERGYVAVICKGFEHAKKCIDNYLNAKPC